MRLPGTVSLNRVAKSVPLQQCSHAVGQAAVQQPALETLMVTASPDNPLANTQPLGELTLRYCGDDQPEMRLRARKCTIGSGPQCTLRLRAAGVDAVHCMIVRGEQRTVIRNWSHGTRHNGRRFDDATLAVGDRLSFGPWQFEVVDLGYGPAEQTADHDNETSTPVDDAELAHKRAELEVQRQHMAEQATAMENELLEFHRQSLELRSGQEQLAADQQAWQAEHAQRQTALEELDARAANLREQSAQLEMLVASFERERQLFAEQQTRDHEAGFGDDAPAGAAAFSESAQTENTDSQRAELDRQAAVLLEQVQLFEAQKGAWEAQCESARAEQELAQKRLTERAEELERYAEQLREQQAHVNARDVAVEGESSTEAAELLAQRQQLEEFAVQLTNERDALETQRAELEAQRAKLERQRTDWENRRAESGLAAPAVANDVSPAATHHDADVEELKARLHAELQAAEDSRRQSQALLAAELNRLSQRERELQGLAEELSQQQKELDRRQSESPAAEAAVAVSPDSTSQDETGLAERTQQLDQRDLELEAARQQLQKERRRLDDESARFLEEKSQLLKATTLFQQRQTELEAQAVALQKQQTELEEYMRQSRFEQASFSATVTSPGNNPSAAYDDLPSLLGRQAMPRDEEQAAEFEVATAEAVDQSRSDGRLLAMLKEDASRTAERHEESAADAAEQTGEQKEDLRDLLRRMGSLPEDEEPAAPVRTHEARPIPSVLAKPAARVMTHHEAQEEDHDTAVQAYMARLLKRDTQLPAANEPIMPQTSAAPIVPERPVGQIKSTSAFHDPSPPVARQYVRVAAPEKQTDLNALREVANQSAEAALEKFRRRKATFNIAETLFMAVSAGVGASFIVNYDPFGPTMSIFATLVCVILMAVMLGRTLVLVGRLQRLGGGQPTGLLPKLQVVVSAVREATMMPAASEQPQVAVTQPPAASTQTPAATVQPPVAAPVEPSAPMAYPDPVPAQVQAQAQTPAPRPAPVLPSSLADALLQLDKQQRDR